MSLDIAVTQDLASCHLLRRIVFIEEQGVSESRLLILEGGQAEWPY